jgi:purine-binding chemotaxis protein CheW
MTVSGQYCTFQIGDMTLGVNALAVQEIIRAQPTTRVPLAEPAIAGLINLRGQIVTAIELRCRLRLPPRPADARPMNVVVRTPDGVFSLLVDRICDVIDVSETAFDRPPENVAPDIRALIVGAFKLPDRLLLVLDTDRLVRADTGAGDLS